MDDVDDLELKAQIDLISRKIDAIIDTVERLDPVKAEEVDSRGED